MPRWAWFRFNSCLSLNSISSLKRKKKRLALQAKSLGEQEWRSQQLGGLGGHHFESDTEMSDMDDDDRETLFSSMDLLSPGGHSDAQTLAMMLQEQLDAINKEIRYRAASSVPPHHHLSFPDSCFNRPAKHLSG